MSELVDKLSLETVKTTLRDHPWKTVYYSSLVLGFIIRLVVSLNAWGMKHPDEVYQSLEMAHLLVYGEGHIPPEFQNSNNTIPSYAAARSWLFPYIFAGLMWLGEFLGLSYLTGTLVMIKIYMAIHATLLIPAVYKLTQQLTSEHETATIAAVAVAFWFRVIEYTVRTFTNTFFLPFVFYGLYIVFKSLDQDTVTFSDMVLGGFLLGISTYIRIDMGIIVFSFFVVYFSPSHILHYLKYGVSSFIFWVWGALIDFMQYEGVRFFSVPINWFTFNIIEGYSEIFGVSPVWSYVGNLLFGDLLFPWLIIMILWIFHYYYRRPPDSILNEPIGGPFKRLFLTNVLCWGIYSNAWPTISLNPLNIAIEPSHKEIRFVIGALVLFLIAAAVVTRLLAGTVPQFLAVNKSAPPDTFHLDQISIRRYRNQVLLYLFACFIILSMFAASFRADGDHHEGINKSLIYVGQQDNPTAIIIVENWFASGYYTYSHVDNTTFFKFYPIHDSNFGALHAAKVKSEIRTPLNNSYIIIPGIQYYFFEQHTNNDFKELLQDNNWELVYSFDNTDTWIFSIGI